VKILQLVSCRGWSSDAYWAARVSSELERRGHAVVLGCRAGTEQRVIERARAEGVTRTTTFAFTGGVHPRADLDDTRRLARAFAGTDIVHVHRGKEHWLAAIANRLTTAPRPLVRTRHIVPAVRPHAGNRWLYRHATALVVTVSDAIRRQYLAAGLLGPEQLVAIPGGADVGLYRPGPADPGIRAAIGGAGAKVLVGLVAGLRIMKAHDVVIDAARTLQESDTAWTFVGRGSRESAVREAIARHGLEQRITIAGFVDDVPAVMRALDIGLYVSLESEGMSRVVFEYLAAGVPLIASRVGVVPEILADGEHALLVPAADVRSLAEAVSALAGDPARRARLADAGRRLVVEQYSGARVAERLEARYDALLNGPRSAPAPSVSDVSAGPQRT
jgi:glycosyltransferase involved in cell wall biosynthesis